MRNTFAAGGSDLEFRPTDLPISILDSALFPLIRNFLETEWPAGLVVIFQIYCNAINFYQEVEKRTLLERITNGQSDKLLCMLEKIKDIDEESKVKPLVCALTYNELRTKKTISPIYLSELILYFIRFCLDDQGDWLALLIQISFKNYSSQLIPLFTVENLKLFPHEITMLIE